MDKERRWRDEDEREVGKLRFSSISIFLLGITIEPLIFTVYNIIFPTLKVPKSLYSLPPT
jgi:hypothetical protein